jgi:predicted ribosomally synthesized peptide with nif11-like leader
MNEEQLEAFISKLRGDNELQEKLKLAEDSAAVAAIAREAGFEITADELDLHSAKLEGQSLSDEELEQVAGGRFRAGMYSASCGSSCVDYNKGTGFDLRKALVRGIRRAGFSPDG